MFRNFKLKNTVLCELSVLFAPALTLVSGLIAFVLIPNEDIASLVLIAFWAVAFILLVSKIKIGFSLDFTLTSLRNWQKDRLSFSTDINGVTAAEVERAVTQRASKWSNLQESSYGAVLTRYKKIRTLNDLTKVVHQKLIVYSSAVLTYEDYRQKLDNVCEDAKAFIDGKTDEECAVGVIFLSDRVEQAVLTKVRGDYIVEDDYLVLPLLYDGTSRQYCFDALYDYNIFWKTTKNYILNTIKKIVFGGKLPLENNDRFDYSNEISVWQDRTLGDLLDDIKENDKKDNQFVKETAEQLSDGQVLYHDETLYLKHNGRLASFLAFSDEDNPDKILIWDVDIWAYPKQSDISKKDQAVLKQMAIDYFKTQNKQAIFDPEELE